MEPFRTSIGKGAEREDHSVCQKRSRMSLVGFMVQVLTAE